MVDLKRKTAILIMVLTFVTAFSSVSADDYFYYSLGQQITAQTSDSLITIIPEEGYRPGTKDAKEIYHPAIDQDYDPVQVGGNAWEYHLLESWDLDSALDAMHGYPGIEIANPIFGTPDSTPVYLTDEFILRFGDEIHWIIAEDIINSYNLEIVEPPVDSIDPHRYVVRMTAESGLDLLEVANLLYANDTIDYSVPNFHNNIRFDAQPVNDPYYEHQWHLPKIGFEEALDFTNLSNEVYVAILDVGFDLDHEDMDLNRIHLTYDAAGDNIYEPYYWDYDVSPPVIDSPTLNQNHYWGHGMKALGLINATMNNETGVVGIAPSVKYILIKVVDSNKNSKDSRTSLGIDMAALHAAFSKCHVISASWHEAYQTDDIEAALSRAHKWQAVTFAAAEDEAGEMAYPATSQYTIAVGATNEWDVVENFSASGPELDLVAPGIDLWTTDRMGNLGSNPDIHPCTGDKHYFCRFWGTSASCAIAAGVAAKLFAVMPEAMRPMPASGQQGAYGHPVDFMRQVLLTSADDMVGSDNTPGWDPDYGHGRVNAHNAMLTAAEHCLAGDANHSTGVDIDDVVYLINYIFGGGPPPHPMVCFGDANGSGGIDIDDVVYLIQYIFASGPAPDPAACDPEWK